MPGEMKPSGLSTTARSRIVPELRSSALSRKSTRPFQRYSVSSCRRISTRLAFAPPASRLYFSSADSGTSNRKRIGFSVTIVVSTVVSAATMLPGAKRRYDARPASGAVTRVNERFRSCGLHRRLGRRDDSRPRLQLRGDAHLGVRLADELVADERLRALELRVGIRELRARARDLRLRVRELRGVGPRVDDEQQLALLHDLPVLEVHGLDRARDSRPHLDGIHGLEAARVVVPVGHALGEGCRHFYQRQRLGRRRGLAATGAERGDEGGRARRSSFFS